MSKGTAEERELHRKSIRERVIAEAGDGFDAMYAGVEAAIIGGSQNATLTFSTKFRRREDGTFDVMFSTKPSFQYQGESTTADVQQGVLALA